MLIVHGSGGNRASGVRHARTLARHGYGVLLYDAREFTPASPSTA